MVRIGDEYKEKDIIVRVKEVFPHFSASGKSSYMIGYEIQDGEYTSPLAHFWMGRSQDFRVEAKKVIEYYLSIVHFLRGKTPQPTMPTIG